MPPHPATLQNVADAAGVSMMTVSRALRNHPEVSEATRLRVTEIAGRLGYRPDPFVSRAMSRARSGRVRTAAEPLAVVWPHALTRSDRENPRRRRLLEGVRSRAALLGMVPQEFELDEIRVTPERLSRTLFNRGVRALLLLPAFPYPSGEPAFTWERFTAATLGYGPMAERLHRASHDHFEGMRMALQRLSASGCRRVAAILPSELDEFVHRRYSAAFLAFAPQGSDAPGCIRRTGTDAGAGITGWIRKGRFDGVVVHNELPATEAAGIRRHVRAVASLHWLPDSGFPGVDQSPEDVAAAAIDILMGQLTRNERGLPERPRTLLVPGVWREPGTPHGLR